MSEMDTSGTIFEVQKSVYLPYFVVHLQRLLRSLAS